MSGIEGAYARVLGHRRRPRPRGHAGFTLLELAIVIAVVSVLAAFFLDRALISMEAAERMAMETQARAIGAGLQLQMAALITRGRERDIASLANVNPTDWLVTKPPNYLGELTTESVGEAAQGHWYYDPEARELIYLVRRGERFDPDSQGRKRVRFHVEILRGSTSTAATEFVGIVFKPVVPYRWL